MITKNIEQVFTPGNTLVFKWPTLGSAVISHSKGDYWTHAAKIIKSDANRVWVQEAINKAGSRKVVTTAYDKYFLTTLLVNKTMGVIVPMFKFNPIDVEKIALSYEGLPYDNLSLGQIVMYTIYGLLKKMPKFELITPKRVICSEHCARFDYDLSKGAVMLGYNLIADKNKTEYKKSYDRIRPQELYLSKFYEVLKYQD
jgi:hypothetical protein